ncbi:MAG: glycan-binding surface protein [Sphingobacteriales bacterium]
MKKNSLIQLCLLPLLFAMVALFPACKKNSDAAPVITSVRMYHAFGKDTLLSTGNLQTDPSWTGGTNKYVVIIGQNLQNATSITIDGTPVQFNPALFSANSVVVPIPAIVFSQIDTTKLYKIFYTTKAGTAEFSFKLGAPAPTITAISNVFANPGDSVYVYGANLVLVQNFSYAGNVITSFTPSVDGTSIGFLMPATQPTKQITVTTKFGAASATIVATPTISWISNENAEAGDSVYIHGNYLKNISSLMWAGTAITSFTTSKDTKTVAFVMPTLLAQSGPVSITTSFGTDTTPYHVNTLTYLQDGVIENMDGGWNFNGMNGWWGSDGNAAVDDPALDVFGGWLTHTTLFDGVLGTNHTVTLFMNNGALKTGQGGFAGLHSNPWIPTANLSDPVGNWALKFEFSIPSSKPWNGGSLCFKTDFAGSTYVARYEPWQISASATANYSTKGWQTVTIPLSSFRATDPTLGDGAGASVTSLGALVGTGSTGLTIYLQNFATVTTQTGFYGGIDNVRVVKIK